MATTTNATTTTVTKPSSPKIALDKLAHNDNNVYLCKIFISIMFGVMAGVFGLTGIYGFLLFGLSSLFSSFLIILTLPKVKYGCFSVVV